MRRGNSQQHGLTKERDREQLRTLNSREKAEKELFAKKSLGRPKFAYFSQNERLQLRIRLSCCALQKLSRMFISFGKLLYVVYGFFSRWRSPAVHTYYTVLCYITTYASGQKNVCESLKDWPEMLVRVLLDLFTGD